MTIYIKDKINNQFYCLPGGGNSSSFSYWSDHDDEAYEFPSIASAEVELDNYDLTEDGKRNPEIIQS